LDRLLDHSDSPGAAQTGPRRVGPFTGPQRLTRGSTDWTTASWTVYWTTATHQGQHGLDQGELDRLLDHSDSPGAARTRPRRAGPSTRPQRLTRGSTDWTTASWTVYWTTATHQGQHGLDHGELDRLLDDDSSRTCSTVLVVAEPALRRSRELAVCVGRSRVTPLVRK